MKIAKKIPPDPPCNVIPRRIIVNDNKAALPKTINTRTIMVKAAAISSIQGLKISFLPYAKSTQRSCNGLLKHSSSQRVFLQWFYYNIATAKNYTKKTK